MAPPEPKEEIILPDTTQEDDEDDDGLPTLRPIRPMPPRQFLEELDNMDIEDVETIIRHINDCLLPKLTKNYDETANHAEINIRNYSLDQKMNLVMEDFERYAFRMFLNDDITEADKAHATDIATALLILYKELLCTCSWNTDVARNYARTLDDTFNARCNIKLEDLLQKNDACESQLIYDKCLDQLCKKLTCGDFKKYPGQIEVYCDLVLNFKDFDVAVNPIKILPVALILMDDYIESNKCKGLLCGQVLLNELNCMDFENGNYYDVIYLSVKNSLTHKDLKIIELTQGCALELCQVFPAKIREDRIDEMFTVALEQLLTESNLYRKAAFFKYTKKLMEMLEVKCVGKSTFKTIVCDTLENCLTDSVADIVLMPCLECLEVWIKYCWPVWKLPVDFKLLCALLKYYSKGKTGEAGILVQKLIVTLVALCSPDEQKQFTAQLEGKNEAESTIMVDLKKDIGINTTSQ